ncbi:MULTISPECIES: flagellar biosynthesis protein FliQ [Sphingomonas]|jgi:flagellar biosynthetic protein FliQ|uniref:Flagellar biosynthetic protein FliQ n=1 Tax=Sphingomonas cynarae TaxID=930197 RepID=A0ABP7DPI8_9SPHN|nr:flagellar biosynthesis protein FliQ [Sphingomonas sp. CFBP 8760]MBD8545653.1 flagellar biosynthesis protein FliQ [Sphingomonas sp. CFBP 8760]
MSPESTIEIARATLVVVLTVCGPLLLTALVVGMAISLFQALTQVQEQTLTFLPKLVAMGVVMLLTLPMIGHALSDFTRVVSDHIVNG